MAASQGRQAVSGRYTYQRQTTYRDLFVEGNTVRKTNPQWEVEAPVQKPISHAARKNREKANHMSVGYVIFLLTAMLFSGYILVNYIQLQFQLTERVEQIAAMESQLNTLKQANDETYTQILANIDLEEIKRIAIGELGMTYAKEGQIISFENEGSDYVRQYGDIPE